MKKPKKYIKKIKKSFNFIKIENVKKNTSYIFIAILSLALIILIGHYNQLKNRDIIYSGLTINGIDVSKLTKDEAIRKIIEQSERDISKKNLKFLYDDKSVVYPLKDFGYSLAYDKAVEQAYMEGRTKAKILNFFRISMGSFLPKDIKLEAAYDNNEINKIIKELAALVFEKAQDANLYVNEDNHCSLVKEVYGRYLDEKETSDLIKENIFLGKDIKLPIYKTEPQIKSDFFEGINKVIGEFSSNYSKSEKNRKDNIKLGSSYFNKLLVKPGKEISFNETVGDITEQSGFKTAGVIVNGEFDRGIGGGICQVSTTLYNALIRADIHIIERSNHTRPISYVPLGTDAAVASGIKDLKFSNNTNHNIYILAKADGDDLSFKIFGNGEDRDYKINIIPKLNESIEPNVIEKYSDEIPEGEIEVEKKGAKGYSYITYKEIVKNQQVLKTEVLSKSYYVPQDRVIIIGQGENENHNKTNKKHSNDK